MAALSEAAWAGTKAPCAHDRVERTVRARRPVPRRRGRIRQALTESVKSLISFFPLPTWAVPPAKEAPLFSDAAWCRSSSGDFRGVDRPIVFKPWKPPGQCDAGHRPIPIEPMIEIRPAGPVVSILLRVDELGFAQGWDPKPPALEPVPPATRRCGTDYYLLRDRCGPVLVMLIRKNVSIPWPETCPLCALWTLEQRQGGRARPTCTSSAQHTLCVFSAPWSGNFSRHLSVGRGNPWPPPRQ